MTSLPLPPAALAPDTSRRLRELAERWEHAGAAERANYQLYLIELCEAIGVTRPRPAATGDRIADAQAYQFEFAIKTTTRDGTIATNYIDLYKAGCFALEAKDSDDGATTTKLLTKAFGQVSNYAKDLNERPPYILVLDVGKSLIVWDRWSGSYGGFHLGTRIDLRTLDRNPDTVALLRDIWTDPAVRDPRRHAQAITVEIAGLLGELASTLEQRGHDPERVARFLIRCVFSMFAEDVKLLPDASFKRLLDAVLPSGPDAFVAAAQGLWQAMDAGAMFGYHRLLRFNGHFFANAEALPLERAELELLRRAAEADWSAVEPSIFGTLLVRALSAEERHRLGAEYTPRDFIERLVRPTVEEPVRERWGAVQAEVMQLRETGKAADKKRAETRLLEFHAWLRGLRILDPACGSGNFLYVTMHALKRVEVEVFHLLSDLHGGQMSVRMAEIDPGQFFGIEVKAWAREIAELTLWIGFHQFWRQQHGDVQPDEPLLRDTGTLEHRDAVLTWDSFRHVPEKDRPDPTPRIVHPVTGQLVPDPSAKLKYMEYVGARAAEWPEADFIVGNPPYLGQARQRDAFGDGYVDALRAAYPDVPDSADFVMYWWDRAAGAVLAGRTLRAGLITTQSITQSQNRKVIAQARERGARVVWAIANHAWCDAVDGAEVRVTMSVLEKDPPASRLVTVEYTRYITGAEAPRIVSELTVPQLNDDLTIHADVATASGVPLQSNAGLATRGFMIFGAGFVLTKQEASILLSSDSTLASRLRPFRNGLDLTSRPRDVYVIDFGMLSEHEARNWPVLFDIVRSRVKPGREANARAQRVKYWWRFGEPNSGLRTALVGLRRYIATPETAKHRFFVFLDSSVAPDNALVCITTDSSLVMGVLSSTAHSCWLLAAGGALEDKPRYNKRVCFDSFPFPAPSPALGNRISILAESLDAHRAAAIARDERVTMTGVYNVVEKLRAGEALTPKERTVHELSACGILRDLHDELDTLVAEAYGWPWPMTAEAILERLVALHDVRVAEEAQGIVRWLRPEFQAPESTSASPAAELALEATTTAIAAVAEPTPWPTHAIEQIAALKRLVSSRTLTVDSVLPHFRGAQRELVARHLETLAILGEVREVETGRFAAVGTY
ncbi:DNA methyltransferase [Gemmatimonas sp.]|uniref:class I SAM-dependent DNA methyltransferase n=1 Tax=Gemmatimonas sp. TaxID=1962908 RepID=UPI00286E348D|nr:DNA methyltransferase [Gemmatimonas sp.]